MAVNVVDDSISDVKKLRTESGFKLTGFSEYFGIPRRTIQGWEGKTQKGARKCVDYLFDLMVYKMKSEGFVNSSEGNSIPVAENGASKIKELRTLTGFTHKGFSEFTGIEVRVIRDWEEETRECPQAMIDWIIRKAEQGGFLVTAQEDDVSDACTVSNVKELLECTEFTVFGLSDCFGIPQHTVLKWELGQRKCPEHLLDLMVYRINREKLAERKIKYIRPSQ